MFIWIVDIVGRIFLPEPVFKFIVPKLAEMRTLYAGQSNPEGSVFMIRPGIINIRIEKMPNKKSVNIAGILVAIAKKQWSGMGLNVKNVQVMKTYLSTIRILIQKITLLKTCKRYVEAVMLGFTMLFHRNANARSKAVMQDTWLGECAKNIMGLITRNICGNCEKRNNSLVSSFKLREGWSYDQPFSLAYE